MGAEVRWGVVRPGVQALVLDSVEFLLHLSGPVATPARGRMVLCRFGAQLVMATAAGHVRYDVPVATARLCLWRSGAPDDPVLINQREPANPGPHDWWTVSRSRRRVYDWIGEEHLAELPLSTDAAAPTLIVVGRSQPFTDADSERLASAYRALILVERLLERLLPPRLREDSGSGAAAVAVAAALTARELQVLEMLGEGLLARSIAVRLAVSERTVHKHLGNVYRKLDVHDRLLAVRRAELLGLIPADPQAPRAQPAQPAEPADQPVPAGW